MSRATVTLNSPARRDQAAQWCRTAPLGTRVTFAEAKRSDAQNRLMWDLLTDIARQVLWHGVRLSADDWKLVFMAALNQEMRLVPNLEGTGFVNLGRSSSKLSKSEMGDLIDLILKFGAERDVQFYDDHQGGSGANNLRAEVAA
ncbi:recombination protein NinB [Phenylobacterium sp. LjRoot164]|uniref:recombination protein NinB n=1 Tax=unclassified Phenylobacterium TaxID=2640670 RepID=UPI003ECD4F7F